MSNFTKSIFYSGVVLAMGLVAIFAISSNMSPEGSQFSAIEPAAGTQMGTAIPEGTAEGFTSFEKISDMTHDAAEATGEMATNAADATTEMATDAVEAVEDAAATAHKTMEDAMDGTMASEVQEAATEATTETGEGMEAARAKVMEEMKSAEPAAGDITNPAADGMDLKTLEMQAVEDAKKGAAEAEAAATKAMH